MKFNLKKIKCRPTRELDTNIKTVNDFGFKTLDKFKHIYIYTNLYEICRYIKYMTNVLTCFYSYSCLTKSKKIFIYLFLKD